MRHAPRIVQALRGPVLAATDARCGWWVSFRQLAEALLHSPHELVDLARAAVVATHPTPRPMFESIEESFEHALHEAVAPRVLSLHIEPALGSDVPVVVAVRADGAAIPSEKAMALLQGGLLGVASRVAWQATASRLGDRECAIEVSGGGASFRDRLATRDLDEDVVALGLDPEKLARLADGLSVASRVDRVAPSPTLRALETQFQLTPTQGRVALRLLEGASLREAATLLNITYGTARVHLKQIFAKLEVRTQAGLVAKLLRVRP